MHEIDYITYSILQKERELLENRGIVGRSIFLEKCIRVDWIHLRLWLKMCCCDEGNEYRLPYKVENISTNRGNVSLHNGVIRSYRLYDPSPLPKYQSVNAWRSRRLFKNYWFGWKWEVRLRFRPFFPFVWAKRLVNSSMYQTVNIGCYIRFTALSQ